MTASLEQALVDARSRLTARVLDEMYADPFWQARFGARGREHSRADGDYHVTYVIEALQSRDHMVFVSYARWLRDLLHAHGMCSRHLAENFERLARAIDDEPWPDRARATAVLAAGVDALAHRDGDAGQIDGARGELARAASATLTAAGALDAAAGGARVLDDLDHHLSYLADALASGQGERFAAHVAFVAELRGQVGRPRAGVVAELDALAQALSAHLPTLSGTAASYLARARAAVQPLEAA